MVLRRVALGEGALFQTHEKLLVGVRVRHDEALLDQRFFCGSVGGLQHEVSAVLMRKFKVSRLTETLFIADMMLSSCVCHWILIIQHA